MLGTPPALILSQDQTLKFNALERAFDFLLCSYFVLLLSCVARCYHRTADTRRAGLLDSASGLATLSFFERVHALSSFQRTKDFDCIPHGRAIHVSKNLDFAPALFGGTFQTYDDYHFPVNPFLRCIQDFFGHALRGALRLFRVCEQPGDFPGSRDVLDREHRVNRV